MHLTTNKEVAQPQALPPSPRQPPPRIIHTVPLPTMPRIPSPMTTPCTSTFPPLCSLKNTFSPFEDGLNAERDVVEWDDRDDHVLRWL